MNKCEASGCHELASGFSTLCAPHKQAMRRHGDPLQDGITVHELRPYVARVATRQAKNKDSDAWAILGRRWQAVIEQALTTLARFEAGHADVGHAVRAAEQVRNLKTVPVDTIVHTALAMYLYRDGQPRRFRSDRAFDFQLVRRVRGLSDVNAGSYWDAQEGRSRRVYRDLPPRVVEHVAAGLKDAFGLAGVMLASKERAEAATVTQQTQRLAAAMEGLE
jgi:hypothetical protein